MSSIERALLDAAEVLEGSQKPTDIAIRDVFNSMLLEILEYEDDPDIYPRGTLIPVDRMFNIKHTDRAIKNMADAVLKEEGTQNE